MLRKLDNACLVKWARRCVTRPDVVPRDIHDAFSGHTAAWALLRADFEGHVHADLNRVLTTPALTA